MKNTVLWIGAALLSLASFGAIAATALPSAASADSAQAHHWHAWQARHGQNGPSSAALSERFHVWNHPGMGDIRQGRRVFLDGSAGALPGHHARQGMGRHHGMRQSHHGRHQHDHMRSQARHGHHAHPAKTR